MSSLSGRTLGCVESMPEIISVYSYVGRGGGDVLTSSVNELYLSGGFIRGFFLLLPPPPPSPPPPPLFLLLPLSPSPPSCLPPPHLAAPRIVSSALNLFLFLGVPFSLRSSLLCDRREFEIHEIRTFQIGVFNLLGPRNYS